MLRALNQLILRVNTDPTFFGKIVYLPWSNCRPSNGTDSWSTAVNALVSNGLLVVVSMGNCSTCMGPGGCASCPCTLVASPAAAADALTVGFDSDSGTECRADDVMSNDSLIGTLASGKPDLVAPGVDIESAQFNTVNGYVNRSGSSTAAAHVAGCAALIDQMYMSWPLDLKMLLVDTAEDHGPAGWDTSWGEGALNCFAAADKINDLLCADMKYDGECGDPPLPSCGLHPSLRAVDWPVEGVPNTILADVKNNGPGFSGDYDVVFRIDEFSNGDNGKTLCTIHMPTLAPGFTDQASCPWKPEITGTPPGYVHACLHAEIVSEHNCGFHDRKAQHNEEIAQAYSPAVTVMAVENTSNEDVTVELQPTLTCDDGACAGWAFAPSSNFFAMSPDDCEAPVTLAATPTPPAASRTAMIHVDVLGHTAGGGVLDLGNVTMRAQLACATTNLHFTSASSFIWNPPAGYSACPSSFFDVARGTLPIASYPSATLRGDFSAASCMANEQSLSQFTDTQVPPVGTGYYYVSRAGSSVPGSWDVGGTIQKGRVDDTLKVCQ